MEGEGLSKHRLIIMKHIEGAEFFLIKNDFLRCMMAVKAVYTGK